MMKTYSLLFIVVLLIACKPSVNYDVVISNVGFFDGDEDWGVVNLGIYGDSLAIISKSELKGDSIISGFGKYVIPGLVNSHTHIWSEEQLKEGFEFGILANIGLHASIPERDKGIKELSKEHNYPHYFTSGYAATVPGGHPTQIISFPIETINDSISPREFVNNRISEGVDFIKIVRDGSPFFIYPPLPTLSYESIEELINYTHSKGLNSVVHISSLEELLEISKFKPKGFVHLWSMSENSELTEQRLNVIKRSNSFIIPTAILNVKGFESLEIGSEMEKWASENFLSPDETRNAIKKLFDSGIMIVAGTDSGSQQFVNWGDDLFYELGIYSEAGMSNLEVLKTATGNAAKAWNIPIGRLEIGSKLNMVLLNGNPIEDLENLREIEVIWKN